MTLHSENPYLERIKRIHPIIWLAVLYGLVVILYTFLSGYCKHLETYEDERIYYSMAEGLAKGLGFPTTAGEYFDYNRRYLYSILIAPAFLTSNRLLQFYLIALINALSICSGAFPVYLMAKDVLKSRKAALLAGILYLLQPDLQFTASFLSENLWLSLALWVIFFSYKLITKDSASYKQKIGYLIGWLFFSVLLIYVKPSGYVVVFTSCIYYLAVLASHLIRNIRLHKVKWKSLVPWVIVILAAAIVFFRYSWLWKRILSYFQEAIIERWSEKPWLHIRCCFFTWATEILAIGIFPMILPLLSYRQLSREGKHLFNFLLLLTAAANLGIVHTCWYSLELYHHEVLPVFHRYIIYIWLPYLIVFFDSLNSEAKPSLIGAGTTLVLTALFCVLFRGAIFGNAFEASLLWWVRGWMQHRWLWVSLVILYTLSGFFLLRHNRKFFIIFFAVIMLCLQAYNHITMYTTIRGAYQFPYEDIHETEAFIKDNPDKNFLVTKILSTQNGDEVEVHYSGKAADTFLLYPNSYFVDAPVIINTETAEGIDLNNREIILSNRTDLRSIDYVILANELFIDWKGCEPVLEDKYFSIYKLDDSAVLPYIGLIQWGREGTMVLNPKNGFLSWYKENDSPTFVSTGVQAHVLHGPYVTLPAGSYSITIHYSYNGGREGRIGLMDLMGSVFEEGEYEAPAFSGQDSVSISFDLAEECTRFEVRLYAEAVGIAVDSIEVEYTAPVLEESEAEPAPAA